MTQSNSLAGTTPLHIKGFFVYSIRHPAGKRRHEARHCKEQRLNPRPCALLVGWQKRKVPSTYISPPPNLTQQPISNNYNNHNQPQPQLISLVFFTSISLIATILLVRPDLAPLLQNGEHLADPIPLEPPPGFFDKEKIDIEGIGEPTSACFLTLSRIDPKAWYPSLPHSASSLLSNF